MDGKKGKPPALIMEPNLKEIKRVEPMTSPNFGENISHLAQDQLS